MSTNTTVWFVIINPTSGNGSAKKKWPIIKRHLEHYAFNFNYAFTEYSGHDQLLVQQAIKQNITNIISVGGDGTIHGIVNGIMEQTLLPSYSINVGVIPIGTGNDWIKTHNIPKNIDAAINIIKNGNLSTQDLGKIEFLNTSKSSVYFNNLAGIGFDGFVVSKVAKFKNFGAIAYLYGTIISLFSFENFNSKVTINHDVIKGKTLMILIGLCKYSGGGMQLTESPNPFDGLFDVSIVENFSKFDILKNLSKLFNGKIHTVKKVRRLKTTDLKIEIEQNDFPFVQADGELLGKADINITIIPRAFSFYC